MFFFATFFCLKFVILQFAFKQLFDSVYIVKYGQDNDLSEFDESRDIIESLVDEYKACESPDYIKWGMEVSSAVRIYNLSDLVFL